MAHNCHGKIIFATATSIWSRQNQFDRGKINLITAKLFSLQQNQYLSRQNQFDQGKIIVTTAKSFLSRDSNDAVLARGLFCADNNCGLTLPDGTNVWSNWFCRDQIDIAVAKMILPCQLWATVNSNCSKLSHACMIVFRPCRRRGLRTREKLRAIGNENWVDHSWDRELTMTIGFKVALYTTLQRLEYHIRIIFSLANVYHIELGIRSTIKTYSVNVRLHMEDSLRTSMLLLWQLLIEMLG